MTTEEYRHACDHWDRARAKIKPFNFPPAPPIFVVDVLTFDANKVAQRVQAMADRYQEELARYMELPEDQRR